MWFFLYTNSRGFVLERRLPRGQGYKQESFAGSMYRRARTIVFFVQFLGSRYPDRSQCAQISMDEGCRVSPDASTGIGDYMRDLSRPQSLRPILVRTARSVVAQRQCCRSFKQLNCSYFFYKCVAEGRGLTSRLLVIWNLPTPEFIDWADDVHPCFVTAIL